MHIEVLEVSANEVFAESKKKLDDSRFKTTQKTKLVDWRLHEEMQQLALEKN